MIDYGYFIPVIFHRLCRFFIYDFSSDIEPDMQRQETDFIHENYKFSQQMLEETIPEWMESAFERSKAFPKAQSELF